MRIRDKHTGLLPQWPGFASCIKPKINDIFQNHVIFVAWQKKATSCASRRYINQSWLKGPCAHGCDAKGAWPSGVMRQVLQLHSLQQMTVPYAKSSCHSPATMWASDMLKDQTISLNNQRCLKYCFLRQAFAVAWICCQTGWSKALIQTVILSNGLSWNTAQTSEWINPADSGDFLDISTSATVRVQGVICWQQTAVLHGLHRNFLLKIYSKSTKTMDCQENLQKRKVICGTVMDLIAIALSLWSSVNIKS